MCFYPAISFLSRLLSLSSFSEGHLGWQDPFFKKGKIWTSFLVQIFKVSIWPCAWICLFRLDSHSVLTRYPEQPCKLISSPFHGGDLYIALNRARAVSVSLQYLLYKYFLKITCWIYPASVLQLRDKNGSRLPNPHAVLHNQSWQHKCRGCLFFHSWETLHRQAVNSLGGIDATLPLFPAYALWILACYFADMYHVSKYVTRGLGNWILFSFQVGDSLVSLGNYFSFR